MAETLTWTQHTFRCRGCERTAFASQEAISDVRAAEPEGASLSDEEVVARFDFCLECLFGETRAGEHVAADVDPCPKGDPECETGDDGSCHDGCEAPRPPAGKRYPVTSSESQVYIDTGEWPDAEEGHAE